MFTPSRPSVVGRETWWCRGVAVAVILLVAAQRLWYFAAHCRLDLAPDEAHYWDWSRHLDWSYYSKGPLVAWIIRASCELFGDWSVSLVGHETIAVRLPAVVFGSLLLASLYVLTVQTLGSDRLALGVVLGGLTAPVISAGSSLMTIDSPYACCWGWALVSAHRAVFRGSWWAWPLAGLATALGILAKYNMAAFVPSVGLFLLTSAEHRRLLFRPGFWVMACTAGLGLVPILIWNVSNDWVTFKHVSRLAGGAQPDTSLQWDGPFVYLAGQFALHLGFWFVAWACAMIAHRPWLEPDAGKRWLWWTSFPMFAVFLVFSVRTGGGELNWPVTAYISGMVLAAAWIARQLAEATPHRRRLVLGGMLCTCGLGVMLTVFVHRSDVARPVLLSLSGPIKPERPYPLRRFDPSCRLRGWRTLAAEIDRLRAARSEEPILAATSWALPGEIGFYCQGHPTVYNIGRAQGDRHSQYDLWRPNPIDDPERFLGRTFLIVGGVSPLLATAFEHVEQTVHVVYSEDGQPIAGWDIVICSGFKGFAAMPDDIGH